MRFTLLTLFCFLGFLSPLEAATVIDTLSFAAGTAAQDSTSGNHLDFVYYHPLPAAAILSGKLSLSHSGNLNEGPTREIWHIFDEQEAFIGILSQSDNRPASDIWTLPQTVIAHMNQNRGKAFGFALSERTSYNSEKIDLAGSQLTLDVRDNVPSIPEPSALILLLIAACLTQIGIKKAEPKY